MRESRVRYDDEPPMRRDAAEEISDLRNKIQKNRQSAGFTEPLPRLPSLPSTMPPAAGPQARFKIGLCRNSGRRWPAGDTLGPAGEA